MSDYGFAPGLDDTGSQSYPSQLRALFGRRPQTIAVTAAAVASIHDLVSFLNSSGQVSRPIGLVFIGGHANSQGKWEVPTFAGSADDLIAGTGITTFETLQDTLIAPVDINKAIVLADGTIGNQPGTPPQGPFANFVHCKGCNLGKAPKFLSMLVKALGNRVNVTAPLHFHSALSNRNYGSWEYLSYEFIVRQAVTDSKKHLGFTTVDDLVFAFQNPPKDPTRPNGGPFTFIGGNAVPEDVWKVWLPKKDIHRGQRTPLAHNLGTAIGARKTVPVARYFLVERSPFTWTVPFPSGNIPVTDTARLAALQNNLVTDGKHGPPSRFTSAHPFPVYERNGYLSLADFLNGYGWTFVPSKDGKTLQCNGERIVYTMLVPITNPDPGPKPVANLLFNFYPNQGSPLTAPPPQLVETKGTLFATVKAPVPVSP